MTIIAPHTQGLGKVVHQYEKLSLRERSQHLELRSRGPGRAGLLRGDVRRGDGGENQRESAPMTGWRHAGSIVASASAGLNESNIAWHSPILDRIGTLR